MTEDTLGNKIQLDLLCPVCRELIDKKSLSCAKGHKYGFDENVFVLLEGSVKSYIDTFTSRLHEIRDQEKFHQIAPGEFHLLPYTKNKKFKNEWQLRKYSLNVLNRLINIKNIRTVLEIGPYNGWLSNRLAGKGLDATAADYFADELDGLKAARHYDNKWFCIQMDIRDLSVIKSKFDLVIINHALQFFNNYPEIIQQSKEVLEKGGMLVLLGLPFFSAPAYKKSEIKNYSDYFKEKYDFQLELFPESFKGFLDYGDLAILEQESIKLTKYPQLFLRNLFAKINTKKAAFFYGVYIKH